VESVFRSHGGQLWRAVMAMTAGRADIADDVVAEAFSRLLVHDKGVRDPVAWLFRTSFRLAARELRREGTRSVHGAAEIGSRDREHLSDRRAFPTGRARRPPQRPAPGAADQAGAGAEGPRRPGARWCLGGNHSRRPRL